MRVFVTGPSGHIGSAVLPELLQAGHEVVGLARSDTSAAAVQSLGAQVRRGDLDDLDGLRDAALDADAVIHLAFDHDSVHAGDLAGAASVDLAVVQTFGEALAGTGKTFIGVGMTRTGSAESDEALKANPRAEVARTVGGLAERGVRSVNVGIPPVVHSSQDRHGFIPTMIGIARKTGVSGYLGEGGNRWPASHAPDIGALYRLALEKALPGSQLPAAAEEGIVVREIAEIIGRHLGVPTVSVPAGQAAEHFEAFAPFMSLDLTISSAYTRQVLRWQPVHAGLLADLEQGHYFTT